MRSSLSFSRSSSSSWALRPVLVLIISSLLLGPLMSEETPSAPTGSSLLEAQLKARLQKVDKILSSLEPRLESRLTQEKESEEQLKTARQLLDESRADIKLWKTKSQEALIAQAESQAALKKILDFYEKLEVNYARLWDLFQEYRKETMEQMEQVKLERNKAQAWADWTPWIALGSFVAGGLIGAGITYLLTR